MRVNGARDTVDNFEMEFRYGILYMGKDRQILIQLRRGGGGGRRRTFKYGGFGDVPNSGALHHVPHGEPLDGFVLRDASSAVAAAEWVDMATVLLVSAAVSSLFGLLTASDKAGSTWAW